MGSRDEQPMHLHLLKFEHFMDIANLIRLLDIDSTRISVVKKEHLLNVLLSYFWIVDSCSDWSQLLFLEAFYIKTLAHKRLKID